MLDAQEQDASTPSHEQALEQLLSERESLEALSTAIDHARKAGISEQAILEARFLFHVDRREDDQIAAMLPLVLKHKETFQLEDSEIFQTVDDWLAVTEYVQALAAQQRGDPAAFKQHITEAFWLSPRQGAAFAPHIDRMRLTQAMKTVRLDFTTRLKKLDQSGTQSLADLMTDRRAMLIHFWSPWSQECEASMNDFLLTAAKLEQANVAVVSILAEHSSKVQQDGQAMLKDFNASAPGSWLVDRKKSPLAQLFRVQNVPAMVLVDPQGNVLFNGHPVEDGLWEALKKISTSIVRPALPNGH